MGPAHGQQLGGQPVVKRKVCFNCKAGDMHRPLFCDDCWRLIIFVLLITEVGGESAHQVILKLLFPGS